MKILSRQDFMKLPEGTIFAKGKPCYWGSLSVKGDTIFNKIAAIDFASRDLVTFDSGDSGEFISRYDEMQHQGMSYPINEDFGRDGCFDDDDLFLIFERADLISLRSAIDAAMRCIPLNIEEAE